MLRNELNPDIIQAAVEQLLTGLGHDAWYADPNLRETPRRVAQMYKELLSPIEPKLTAFPEKHGQMIVLAHHQDFTLCPHHLLPVALDVSVAYIPMKSVVGLSKLARVIHARAANLILQETLTDGIADALFGAPLSSKGSAVLIYGEHSCMQIRGPRSSATTITVAIRGVFKDDPSAKEEFLALVRRTHD